MLYETNILQGFKEVLIRLGRRSVCCWVLFFLLSFLLFCLLVFVVDFFFQKHIFKPGLSSAPAQGPLLLLSFPFTPTQRSAVGAPERSCGGGIPSHASGSQESTC